MLQKNIKPKFSLRAASIAAISLLFALSLKTNVFPAETYPQIDITGYKKYEYTSLNVDNIQNLFQAQAMLGGYYIGGPWQEKLKLRIIGKLTEKLSVSYDLEQMPEMPEKLDVKVVYDKTELTFGDFQANFGGNEFVSASKYLNGVMITSKDNWYGLTFVPSSKLKSETQALVSQKGNNSKGPYNLGHGSIIEGSERVELNNNLLTRGLDYTLDYFSGKITFSRILTPDDEFKYSYEFTNLIDLFFPTVSKRDFVGLQTNFTVDPTLLGVPARKAEKSIKRNMEFFPTMLEEVEEVSTEETVYYPPSVGVSATSEPGSYTVYINNLPIMTVHEISGETAAKTRADFVKKRLDSLIEVGLSTMEISTANLNGEDVVIARERTIATALKSEAKIMGSSSMDLANTWKDNIIRGLMASQEVITAPPTSESVPKEFEWESTGTYKLKNSPVIPYSEKITYMGTQLKKFEDYLINYQDGTITLLRPTLPTAMDPLQIEYQYVDVAAESETLPGSGKGPYMLAHQDIIEGSETVYVNNIPYIRELDYSIDYQAGKVSFFTLIPQTANIVVKYKYLVVTTPPPSVSPVVPRTLNFGVNYLKESGRRGATPPSVSYTDSRTGTQIINNNNTIWLTYMPVTATRDVEVRKNDVLMAYGVDYVFPTVEASTGTVYPPTILQFRDDVNDVSNGLRTGTIKYTGDITSTDEVTVSYEYSKWSSSRYTGSGNGGTLQYFIPGFRNLVPGGEKVYIYKKSDPNSMIEVFRSTSIEGFSPGSQYKINYTDPAYITFIGDPVITVTNPKTHLPDPYYLNDINFTVVFYFVAAASVSERPISHDVIGFNSALKVGDYLNLEGSFARSKTDQVYTTVSTNETRKGDNVTKVFNLSSPGEIIEDSEQVYLNGNKLNRDDQYSFFYDSNSSGKFGVLSFITITPSTYDSISVDYKYQSTGGPIVTISEKQGSAYKFGGSIKPFTNLEVAADYKKIDPDFSPMGGTSIPLGSEYKHVYSKMTPMPDFWPSFWVSGDHKETTTPIGNAPDKFLRAYDKNIATGFNPHGIMQVDFGYREYSTIDDKLTKTSLYNNDYLLQTYTLSLAPKSLVYGEFGFTNRNDARKTVSSTDTRDRNLPSDTFTDYFHTNNTLDLTRRFRVVVDYQQNIPYTISYESGSRAPSRGHLTDNRKIDDTSLYLNSDLNYWGFRRLSAYFNRVEHNEYIYKPADEVKSTLNQTIHGDWVPIDQASFSVDHNRSEIPTISTAYGNPRSERTSGNVRLTPYSSTALGWSGSTDNSLQENGTKTSGNSNVYSIDHTPIKASNYSLITRYSLSESSRKAPLGTELEVGTTSRTFNQDYTVSYDPISALTLTSGFGQEDFTNKNDSSVSPINTKSQSQTTRVGSLYRATEDLDISSNYSVKVTSTTLPDEMTAHKAILDTHAVYKVFTYGTVNYDWSQEESGGEILGGVFVGQDFTKIINSLSLNVVMPQEERMILSSIVLRVAVKWANFTDRLTPSNSFQATLLSFEGTFNF